MNLPFRYDWLPPVNADAIPHLTIAELGEDPILPEPDILDALASPFGSLPLCEALLERKAQSVLFLVDDLTRSTPQDRILHTLIQYVESCGIQRNHMTVLVATGLHRKMSGEEIQKRFGAKVADTVRVVNHDAFNESSLVQVGVDAANVPVTVNMLIKENDFTIAVGQISPHRVAGFSGGAKMIEPGICGAPITSSIHWRGWVTEPERLYGKIENPIRHEMEDIAEKAGLDFIVNVVLDENERIAQFFAGDFRKAFREGASESMRRRVRKVPRADIVIVDSYPYDIDLWQACKAISVAELAVKPGGTVILVTPCDEGLSSHSEEIRKSGYLPMKEIIERAERGEIPRYIACHLMAFGRILERGHLSIVTLPKNVSTFTSAGLFCAENVNDALVTAYMHSGSDAKVLFLRGASGIIPFVNE